MVKELVKKWIHSLCIRSSYSIMCSLQSGLLWSTFQNNMLWKWIHRADNESEKFIEDSAQTPLTQHFFQSLTKRLLWNWTHKLDNVNVDFLNDE